MRADVVSAETRELATEGDDRAGIGAVIAGNEMEARRLAGAVGADERHGLALGDRKAQILHRAQAAEALAQIADDERLSHRAPPRPAPRRRARDASRRRSRSR